MEILQFEPEMAVELARCYNDLVAEVPHCYPMSADAFSSLEALACPLCREESLLAAREGSGETRGFVHIGVAVPPGDEERQDTGEPGIIRFLAYRPGQRLIEQALLEAAESWVRERGRPSILAWSNDYAYPFYHIPYAHLSDRIAHVLALFGHAGYRVTMSELLFEWPDFDPPAASRPEFDFELQLAWREGIRIGARVLNPVLVARAVRDESEAGRCEMAGWGQGSSQPDASDWCFCNDLMIEESLQGRGLGKFLLATGLAEMRKAGFRHTAISTDWDNYRAALFYTNFGYRFLDRTFSFRKDL